MHEPSLFLPFIERFERLEIRYMVTGSIAGILYGEPRVTHDIDLVISAHASASTALEQAFPLEEFYCPPADIIATEVRRGQRGHFNLIHHESGFKADIYIAFDDLHRWAMENRRRIDFADTGIWVAPPEYVILRKMEYYDEGGSQKHLEDIRSILEVTKDIDRSLIDKESGACGVKAIWTQLSGTNEPVG